MIYAWDMVLEVGILYRYPACMLLVPLNPPMYEYLVSIIARGDRVECVP